MRFGEALAQVMAEKDVGPTELSRRSGINKQTINELLKGRTKEPTFSRAKKLADGLGVPLQLFVELTNEEGQ